MLGVALVAAAVLVSAGSVALAWAHVLRIRALVSVRITRALSKVGQLPVEARLGEFARLMPEVSWASRLAVDLQATPDDEARARIVNEQLHELERDLLGGAEWPAAATRIAAFGGLLISVAAYLMGHAEVVLPIVIVGVVGALLSAFGGHSARQVGRAQRAAVDALVTTLLGAQACGRMSVRRETLRPRGRRRAKGR